METEQKEWTCPICQDIKKAQGRGAHLRQAHELKITKITDEELKLALEKNISLKDPELKSKLMSEHKLDISPKLAETSENIKVSVTTQQPTRKIIFELTMICLRKSSFPVFPQKRNQFLC